MFSPSSRGRLTDRDLERFPGETLFDRVARAVCHAGCLPRKELYEAWEVARRVRRLFRGGRVMDLGGGHGLLAQIMIVLDDSSPGAVVVDTALPPSAARVRDAVNAWPRLSGRITFEAIAGRRPPPLNGPRRVIPRVRPPDGRDPGTGFRPRAWPCCRVATTTACGSGSPGWVDRAVAIDVRATPAWQGCRSGQANPARITRQSPAAWGAVKTEDGRRNAEERKAEGGGRKTERWTLKVKG